MPILARELTGRAIVTVIEHACRAIAERAPPLDEKLRGVVHVRGREDQPGDRCGTRLRTPGVWGHDACFCPTCQADAKGRGLVD